MVQMLYSIIAIMLLAVAVLNVNVKIYGSKSRMMFTELASGVTSVGAEMLNEVGQYPYDPIALTTTTTAVLNNRNALRDSTTFGVGSSCNPDNSFSACLFINDFHGKTASRTLTRTYRGTSHTVTYNVEFAVAYVAESPPHTASASKTFAKEVTITISSPNLTNAVGTPLEFAMSRVYTYPNL